MVNSLIIIYLLTYCLIILLLNILSLLHKPIINISHHNPIPYHTMSYASTESVLPQALIWLVNTKDPHILFFPLVPQNFLRCQNNKNNYNLVCETLQFLDCICGSTTGGLGLLGLYINEKNVALINQTVESLTEYCQGPCHENQVDLTHPHTLFVLYFKVIVHPKMKIVVIFSCLPQLMWELYLF